MLSIENPGYDDDNTNPRILAYRRRAIDWKRDGTVEIPLSLTAGWRGYVNRYNWHSSFAKRPIVEYGGFASYLSWSCAPFPHPHISVEFNFKHRDVKNKMLSSVRPIVPSEPEQCSSHEMARME